MFPVQSATETYPSTMTTNFTRLTQSKVPKNVQFDKFSTDSTLF